MSDRTHEPVPDSSDCAEPTPARQPAVLLSIARETLQTLLPAALLAILINLFLAQSTIVLGQSMETNFHDNQRLVIEKVTYWMHGPQRGDVVVIQPPPHTGTIPLIKRVVALAGERIEIREGRVYIDGVLLEEPYVHEKDFYNMPAQVVPPLHIFVLGDNRRASNDSRAFGPVPIKTVLGRAWLSYWPLSELKVIR